MRLQYIFADSAGKPHPFHGKSNWQPPPQPSVALERYLERTRFELCLHHFSSEKDNLSAQQREALARTKRSTSKERTKVPQLSYWILDKKIQKGLEQVFNENYYTPLKTPIVSSTKAKVGNTVKTLFDNGHIDNMTYKWLSSGQNPPRIPELYTLTNIHKNTPVGRPIVSGNSGPTKRISSFVDSPSQPIDR